jgi:hypothetical protein
MGWRAGTTTLYAGVNFIWDLCNRLLYCCRPCYCWVIFTAVVSSLSSLLLLESVLFLLSLFMLQCWCLFCIWCFQAVPGVPAFIGLPAAVGSMLNNWRPCSCWRTLRLPTFLLLLSSPSLRTSTSGPLNWKIYLHRIKDSIGLSITGSIKTLSLLSSYTFVLNT